MTYNALADEKYITQRLLTVTDGLGFTASESPNKTDFLPAFTVIVIADGTITGGGHALRSTGGLTLTDRDYI